MRFQRLCNKRHRAATIRAGNGQANFTEFAPYQVSVVFGLVRAHTHSEFVTQIILSRNLPATPRRFGCHEVASLVGYRAMPEMSRNWEPPLNGLPNGAHALVQKLLLLGEGSTFIGSHQQGRSGYGPSSSRTIPLAPMTAWYFSARTLLWPEKHGDTLRASHDLRDAQAFRELFKRLLFKKEPSSERLRVQGADVDEATLTLVGVGSGFPRHYEE
ncbi:hypothetical protein HPB52_004623 [Rhipicephalus sanguineus]|uniref:Uncharacterized protein n=1 Tax=Rhipicephalus sanguineus TaxID=34632 RepID=A0A9D4QC37_RHISA|nr:hypothetical protein HPB52_004623 [Rhipicephalus sanguineus]